MKKLSIFLALVFCCMAAGAQTVLSGRVTDRHSGAPLNGVNIFIEGTTVGTAAVNNGEFRVVVPRQYIGKQLIFSFVGYRSEQIDITASPRTGLRIGLEPAAVAIDGLVVMPDDRLRALLARAYRRIGDNYPREQSRMSGFYREYTQNHAGDYLYFSEALVETHLNAYRLGGAPQIRMITSVAGEFPARDSLSLLNFSNGVFTAVQWHDFVKAKAEFIDPSHYQEYSYHIEPMTEIDGRPVYVIAFHFRDEAKPGSIGRFYLDRESLAYLGAEWERNAAALKQVVRSILPMPGRSARSTAQYARAADGRMYLKYLTYDIDFERDMIARLEYVTTEQSLDSLGTMPSYAERLEPADIFLHKAQEFHDEGYWDAHNVLRRDSALNAQMQAYLHEKQSITKNAELAYAPLPTLDSAALAGHLRQLERMKRVREAVEFIRRFGFRYGFRYLPTSGRRGLYELGVAGSSVALSETLGAVELIPALSAQVDYRFDKHWSAHVIGTTSIGRKKHAYRSSELGAGYEFLLNRWHNWVGELSLSYGYSTAARQFSITRNPEILRLYGTKFNADRLQFGVGYASHDLTPRIGIKHRLSTSLWWIYANAGYRVSLHTGQRLFVAERSEFFRAKTHGPLDHERVTLKYNGATTRQSGLEPIRWDATIGIMMKF